DRCDGVDRTPCADAAKGSEIRGRSKLAADPQQLGARRSDVDIGRQKRSHLGAARASVDTRGAARQRRAAGTPVRCRWKTADQLGRAGRGYGRAGTRAWHFRGLERLHRDRRARGLAATDYAGISDDMILKFTMAGKFVMQIGRSGQGKGNLDTENVRQATDV